MRGKDAKGNWHEPFNPYRQRPAPGQVHDYVEGSAIQYTFHVMQDPEGLIAAFGGQKPFYRALDAFFTLPSKMPGQNTTGECTGTIGQYAHGNEPSHHVAYFFPYVGRGDRTAEIVREVCDKYYLNKPNGLVGNDDCGQMSAWFVFACLGFYSFNPCGGEYVVGAPQVPKTTLHLEGGKTFTVVANGLSTKNKYVKSVTLNGKPLDGFVIRHEDIMRGGELVFQMCGDKLQESLATFTPSKPDYDTLICHRGESDDAPENTLPAYRMAVERGFGFECDARRLNASASQLPFRDCPLLAKVRISRRLHDWLTQNADWYAANPNLGLPNGTVEIHD